MSDPPGGRAARAPSGPHPRPRTSGGAERGSGELRVAFQGEPGAYSEEAARTVFGAAVEMVPCRSFQEVARSVLSGSADRGLLPVENTLAGTVVGSYDVLAGGEMEVVGEVVRPIRHCLLGVPGADAGELAKVLSHPVALAQCTSFFRERPGIEAVAVYDTAGAARTVAEEGDRTVGALAGRGAAARYGLEVLAADLQDRPDNQTRFYVVCGRSDGGSAEVEIGGERHADPARGAPEPLRRTEAGWKTAILFRTRNEPGALVRVLRPFADREVNLSKLESRPGEDPWTYRFFLELEDRGDRGPAREAIEEAREEARELGVLGVFPRWRTSDERGDGDG